MRLNQQMISDLSECEAFFSKLERRKKSSKCNKSKNERIEKKNELMKNLNDILGQLNNNLQCANQVDKTLQILQQIEETAKEYNFYDIKRLAVLGIGKRIINLEIFKKQQEFKNKQKKKNMMHQEYRDHRIKQFNYQQLEDLKFKEKTFIFQPYQNSKGFNAQKNKYKSQYSYCFQYMQFRETIRQVNKIFFGDHKIEKQFSLLLQNIIINITTILYYLIVFIFILLIYINHILTDSQLLTASYIFFGFIASIILLNLVVNFIHFYNKPQDKTELQVIIESTIMYLNEVNERVMNNKQKRIKYIWNCPDQFLFIQVKFLEEFPSQIEYGG